jgi:hypothetical protein
MPLGGEMKCIKATAAAAALLLLQQPAAAQNTWALPPVIDCTEVVHVEANDENSNYEITRTRDREFSITFAEGAPGQFSMIGPLGMTSLITHAGDNFVHFIEVTGVGNMNVTTIATVPQNGKYSAVHSRHPVIWDKLIPSQYLLSCVARR